MSHLSNRHSWFRVPKPDDPKDYFLVCERCSRETTREDYWNTPNNCTEHIRSELPSSSNAGYASTKRKYGVR